MTDTMPPLPEPDMCHRKSLDDCDEESSYSADQMHAYGQQCAAAERERCATQLDALGCDHCAAAIRALPIAGG